MQLVDSNVWLALALSDHTFHAVATEWFAERGEDMALFCRATQNSFLRLLTTSAVFALYATPVLSNKAAWDLYEEFLSSPTITWIEEPRGVEKTWRKFASGSKSSPKLWMDAYLAAFAVEGAYQLVTIDKAFKQFKGLDVLLLTGNS